MENKVEPAKQDSSLPALVPLELIQFANKIALEIAEEEEEEEEEILNNDTEKKQEKK